MFIKYKIIFFFILFFSAEAIAQVLPPPGTPGAVADTGKTDTLFFLNGEVRAVKVVDTAYHLVRFLSVRQNALYRSSRRPGGSISLGRDNKRKKPKVLEVEKDRLFSVKFSDGQERILYFHDSAIGNTFTVLEAKMFMLGEQEAGKNYRNILPAVIGFAVGTASPVLLSNAVVLSPIPAAVSPLYSLIPYIKVNAKAIENKNYLQYDTYIMGYEKVARKKNFMHALISAGAGFATGLGIWATLK